jgi:hypothetical protein
MKEKIALPVLLMVIFALTRLPGVMPENFSAAYAIAFCAGVFFPGKMTWWLPLVTLLITDLALNCYYQFSLGYECFTLPVMIYMLGNYAGYLALIWLGKRFSGAKTKSFSYLLGGGILGALMFYLITNTLSWLLNPFNNPEYTKNVMGWIWALTKGTSGWPETWQFFRNTLMSGGLFTALFIGAMKVSETRAEAKEEKESEESEEETEPEATEAPAKKAFLTP